MRIKHTGTIRIVSSGYSDRFPMSRTWYEIEREGVTYRIDGDVFDAARAWLTLSECEITPDALVEACKMIRRLPLTLFGTARYANSTTTAPVSHHLSAGVAVATGFPTMTPWGIDQATADAAKLTAHDWAVIATGLREVNEHHERIGKPAVNFTIPVAGTSA
jgi:hypothetical protein